MKRQNSFKFCFALLLLSLLVSCASMKTSQDQYVDSEAFVKQRNFDLAAQIIEEGKTDYYTEKDRVLYYLDVGLLQHFAGEYQASNESLTQAEYAIEELYTKSVSKAITSGVLNDNALDYSGEDYEDIYINIFKSLNYLGMGDRESAHVEVRRVNDKLRFLEDKYKKQTEDFNSNDDSGSTLPVIENRFYNDALARYLSLLLYRTDQSWDDARIDREKIEEAFERQVHLYNFPMPSLPASRPEDDKARLNLLTFTGLGPVKLAETLYIHTVPHGVILAATSQEDDDYVNDVVGFDFLAIPGMEEGYHFKFQFPRLENRGSEITDIYVSVNGSRLGAVPRIENMERIAGETFKMKQPLTIGKTIIRSTLKNVAKEMGTDKVDELLQQELGAAGALAGFVIGLAADVAVDLTENADLRGSHFFPAYANMLEVSLEPGVYDIDVEYYSHGQLLFVDRKRDFRVEQGELNLVESFYL